MRRRSAAGFVALMVLAVGTASCTSRPLTVFANCDRNARLACTDLDGFPVGRLARDCGPSGAGCGDVGALTRRALDDRVPFHPPVSQVQEFEPDMNCICSGRAPCVLSGRYSIVIFTFVGGSSQALGYMCPGVAACRATFTDGGYADGYPSQPPDVDSAADHEPRPR